MTPIHPRLTNEIKQRVLLLNKTNSKEARHYLGQVLDVKKSQRNYLYNRIVKEAGNGVKYSATSNQAELAVSGSMDSLDEVLKYAKVDTNEWEVQNYSVAKESKAVRYDGKSVPMPVFNFRIKLKRREISSDSLLTQFTKQAEDRAPKIFKYTASSKMRDCLYVLNIQDLHLAKLAWGKETGGADYDINIAKKVYIDAVQNLMDKAPRDRIEEVVLIAGSDFFQVDNDHSTTTAGTYVDSDSRLHKAFEEGTKLLTDIVEKLSSDFKVRVIVIGGNHDESTSKFLGFYLSAFFRYNKNVTVDNSPQSRKYVSYGCNLIGFNHGDKVKLSKLPLIMMRENQSTISKYKYQEWLTGHLHSEKTDETNGIKVRTAPSLCAPDAWHSEQGYVCTIRTSQGLLYHKSTGLWAIYYSQSID